MVFWFFFYIIIFPFYFKTLYLENGQQMPKSVVAEQIYFVVYQQPISHSPKIYIYSSWVEKLCIYVYGFESKQNSNKSDPLHYGAIVKQDVFHTFNTLCVFLTDQKLCICSVGITLLQYS